MRFLCLHGRGTSAAIFRSQTASFRLRLDSTITFEFVDGRFPSEPPLDIAHFYPPPYYTYWEGNSVPAIRDAHEWLRQKLARDGPYDGVLLFSQGCNLIASFLLYHQATNPAVPPPFKVAVFICGGVSLNVLENLGHYVSQEAHEWNDRTRIQLEKKNNDVSVLTRGKNRWASCDTAERDADTTVNIYHSQARDLKNVYGLDLSQFPESSKIQIPTVHIYGSQDPRYPAALQLAYMCDERARMMYDTGSGHDIPRSKEVSEAIADLIRWCQQICAEK